MGPYPMRSLPAVRRAQAKDAEAISRIILRALRVTNVADYPPHVIDAVARNFTPRQVSAQLTSRQAFVAVVDGRVVGTASLHGQVVRSVYVDPDHQNCGIGSKLMDAVEQLARDQSIGTLGVPSSITAQGFYRRRGFVVVREEFHDDERTIVMKKVLA